MKINEIFYSLQGEGFNSGRPAVFVRFSGCNLKCDFCDTLHQTYTEMSEAEILASVSCFPSDFIVLTGGEPSLQLTESFIDLLHSSGKLIAIETNGTHPLPHGIDWITCSPKYKTVVLTHCNELKVVYEGQDMAPYDTISADYYFLQPCDRKDPVRNAKNLQEVVAYCLEHPKWNLSMQIHKILNIQ